ncbi:MAG: sulfatase [Planctomycetota bacterium]
MNCRERVHKDSDSHQLAVVVWSLFLLILPNGVFVTHTHAQELASHARRPNVLFIAIDDLKPLLGCDSHDWIQSPAIDQLAARGTIFTSAYCQVPLCAPTRVSLLTGLRPDETTVYFNPFKVENILRQRLPDVVTLPQHFRNHGYVTCAMGKVFDGRTVDKGHDAASWSAGHIRRFEEAPGGLGPRGYQDPATKQLLKRQQEATGRLGLGPPVEGCEGPDNMYYDGAMGLTAAKTIGELAQRSEPFFLAVGFVKPHLPFIAPKKYWDLYDRDLLKLAPFQEFPQGSPRQANVIPKSGELREYAGVPRTGPIPESLQRELLHGYAACISFIDAQVGILMQTLEDRGIADNTIICLWGDHGWHLGEHGHWGKSTTYEDATRCPLIIYAPQQLSGIRTSSLVELLDIYPTLCQLADLPTPQHVQGKSLMPLMRDPLLQLHEVAISQSCTVDSQRSRELVSGKIDEMGTIHAIMGWAARSSRYRYVEWRRTKLRVNKQDFSAPPIAMELYNYEVDPLEKRNLANSSDYIDVVRQHQAHLYRVLPDLANQTVP